MNRLDFAIIIITCLMLLSLITSAYAQDNSENIAQQDIEISGFFDLQYSDLDHAFEWGQVELDFSQEASKSISISGAVAYDQESEGFGIGAAYIDFRLFSRRSNFCLMTRFFDRAGIVAGQFDMPFGIDWKVYHPLNRKLISMPLVVKETHGAWSDAGVMYYAEQKLLNLRIFHANFINPNSLDDVSRGLSGGRIGITPFEWIEAGGSFARDFRGKGLAEAMLSGLDVEIDAGPAEIKGEYLRLDYSEYYVSEKVGWYVQGAYGFRRISGVYRAENLESGGGESTIRHCVGAGLKISDSAQIRSEYQIIQNKTDMLIFQVAAGF